jgi:hypothetical protein
LVPIRIGDEGGEAQFPPLFYLHEWAEARGILQHIDLQEGILTFEGFFVRIPSSLSARLSGLHALIGQNVSIIRTDSATHIITQARAQVTIRVVKRNQTTPNTFVDARERAETNKARTEPKEDS